MTVCIYIPFLVSLLWNVVWLLLGDQTGSEERRGKKISWYCDHTHKEEILYIIHVRKERELAAESLAAESQLILFPSLSAVV